MDEDVRTLWCGNLSDRVTEEILYELFLQAGPVQRVIIPKDRDGKQRTYGFITYKHINSVAYALYLFDGTLLFNRPVCISTRNNTESSPKANTQDLNPNQLLQLGQQMLLGNNIPQLDQQVLLGNNIPHMKMVMFGANMLPSKGPHSRQVDPHPYDDNRRSARAHPYRRENTHNTHRSNNYSRRDYKSHRRNYR